MQAIMTLKKKEKKLFNHVVCHTNRDFFKVSENSSAAPVGIYLLKVNNRNTRTRCEICSKLTIKTPERRR